MAADLQKDLACSAINVVVAHGALLDDEWRDRFMDAGLADVAVDVLPEQSPSDVR